MPGFCRVLSRNLSAIEPAYAWFTAAVMAVLQAIAIANFFSLGVGRLIQRTGTITEQL